MTIRVALLVDSPSRRAHGNAVSRLALGSLETGRVHVDLVCYSDDPPPAWLPAGVRMHRLGVDRISRSVPGLSATFAGMRPDVLITRQVHANFVGLAAARMARTPPGWRGKLVLVQDHPVEYSHASNWRDNKWAAKVGYRFADGLICPSPTVRDDTIRWCGLDRVVRWLWSRTRCRRSPGSSSAAHPWLGTASRRCSCTPRT